jgi:putative FmdB family regulatory protein
MPLYEYACRDCNTEFELLIRGQEQPQCPHCESHELTRLLSAPAAHTAGRDLPLCTPATAGGCGLPQCGQGGCRFE